MSKPVKNNKKIINAWTFYDWANSVYPLVITAAIFPAYYESVTQTENGSDIVNFLGLNIKNTVLYSYAFSISFLIIAILSPLLSGIADYSGKKKAFMRFFVFLGAVSCSSLFFFDGNNLLLGIGAFMLASIGFNGSLVFYNAYLPEIVTKDKMDKVSAKGYAMGYLGSVILLLLNFLLILNADNFGIHNNLLPYKISFLTVGIWWIGFSQYTLYHLPSSPITPGIKTNYLFKGFEEIASVFKELVQIKNLLMFLLSFFFYSMGVQTVIYMATLFGIKELGIATERLIIAIIIIQVVGILGAYFFSFISKIKGNIFSLSIALIIWVLICISAYFIYTENEFFILAFFVGFVMGGIQSISRSTYAKLIPKDTKNTASYFSFSELTEKVAIVFGLASYGIIESLTNSMRNSIIFLTIFFVIGFIFLLKVNLNKSNLIN